MRPRELSLPRSSRLSYRPGETPEPGTATRIGGDPAGGCDLRRDGGRSTRNAFSGPLDSLPAEVLEQAPGVLVRWQRPQVHPVHPVELRVVEGRRAGTYALEGKALNELSPRHDRRPRVRGAAA